MRRGSLVAVGAAVLALALAACPGGGGIAKPAPVEIDWPDAASQVPPARDAGH